MQSLHHVSKVAIRVSSRRRWIHSTAARHAVSKFAMPAMSPTMTEGGIASWKKKEGETFVAGDVLLEIETDKATIDVEAQDDGVLGKILATDGMKNVPVGKTIALIAEEGDDISNLQVPADEPAPSPKESQFSTQPSSQSSPATKETTSSPSSGHHDIPTHSRPLFPSVLRIIQEHSVSQDDIEKIKGTGVRGMLTKGDVLAHLGFASSPTGTFRETPPPDSKTDTKTGANAEKKDVVAPLDGAALRKLIVGNMLEASIKARTAAVPKAPADFDSIVADYLPPSEQKPSVPAFEPTLSKPSGIDPIDALL